MDFNENYMAYNPDPGANLGFGFGGRLSAEGAVVAPAAPILWKMGLGRDIERKHYLRHSFSSLIRDNYFFVF